MKKFYILAFMAISLTAFSAVVPWPVENVAPTATACGTYLGGDTVIGETGCEDRAGLSSCDDGSPWFINKNFSVSRQHLTKRYSGGTRNLCTNWSKSGTCCNTVSEPPCPASTCIL